MGAGTNPLIEFPVQRREHLRWDACLPCTVRGQRGLSPGLMLDVSQEGAFIQVDEAPEPGAPVELTVQMGERSFQIEARTTHARQFEGELGEATGIGVRFLERPPAEILHRMRHAQLDELVPQAPSASRSDRKRSGLQLNWLLEINKEVWLVLSLVLISLAANFLLEANEMVLGFYSFPTVFSAYFFGRRHATLTALGSVLLVVLVAHLGTFNLYSWLHVVVWGGTLVITGYAMGTLYEKMHDHIGELRETYHGVLVILQHFIAKDKYTQNHSHRVSIYASKIGARMGLNEDHIEDVRVAALLHDIGKLDISRDILYKASRLTAEEYEEIKGHVDRGISMLKPVGGSLRRVLPIILAHHDRFDGSGYHPARGEEIPLAARIISVADVYDAVTSDRPYRKAMSPLDAKEMIVKGSGTDFDPRVVQAFVVAFRMGEMEIPEIMV